LCVIFKQLPLHTSQLIALKPTFYSTHTLSSSSLFLFSSSTTIKSAPKSDQSKQASSSAYTSIYHVSRICTRAQAISSIKAKEKQNNITLKAAHLTYGDVCSHSRAPKTRKCMKGNSQLNASSDLM
jgi:hypothetical protein